LNRFNRLPIAFSSNVVLVSENAWGIGIFSKW